MYLSLSNTRKTQKTLNAVWHYPASHIPALVMLNMMRLLSIIFIFVLHIYSADGDAVIRLSDKALI